jgi:hypothetical protein
MVARDRELLLAHGRLYDDAIAFLEALRARGIRIAIVSNCGETTRPLLVKLGVDVLADVMVLSCETGSAKPDARIFTRALDQLGSRPEAAVSWTIRLATARAPWRWASPRRRSCGASRTGRRPPPAPRWCGGCPRYRRCSRRSCPPELKTLGSHAPRPFGIKGR